MKKIILILFLVFCVNLLFAQNNYQNHTVKRGETVYSISKMYMISEETIYRLNPDVKHVIKTGLILILPLNGEEVILNLKVYRVKRKESIKSIALKFNIPEDLLKKYNKDLYIREVNKGERIKIPLIKITMVNESKSSSKTSNKNSITIHTVLPRETKYGIAKQYKISVTELEYLNPTMGVSLNVGDKINIPKSVDLSESMLVDEDEFELYEVLPKEGFFRLKIKLGLDRDEIISLNPSAVKGLKEGMILKIPKLLKSEEEIKKAPIDLSKYIVNKRKKKIAVMLPFNYNRIDLDSINANIELLKKDVTLGVAIDFYSGVLMAAEFMKDRGVSSEIKVFDTEGKVTKVEEIISSYNFNDTDAIIGPLLSKSIEKAAADLQSKNIPVFSPLSKVKLKEYPNLHQTLPSNESMEKAMLSYISKRKDTINTIVITGKEWTKSKGVIMAALPKAKTIVPDEGNYLYIENIVKQIDTTKQNWVILHSNNPILVSNVVGLLNGIPKVILDSLGNKIGNNRLRLFAVNKSRAFDYNDVSNIHLANLNFTYPSVNKHYDYEILSPFLVSYKYKYGVMPNKYAIRGFDVTYDILLRLANAEVFEEAFATDIYTEYIENKFQYIFDPKKGYKNQVFYIIKYNNELKLEVVE
jgi:LysM repeat protein